MRSPLRALAIPLALGASLWLVGCGGDSAGEDVVRVEATEFAYELPDRIEGGLVAMELVNAGDAVHEWAFGRLLDGRTESDFRQELLAGRVDDLRSIERVASVYAMTPGRSLTLARELGPGRYVVFCTMPVGDRAHFQLGMIRGFEIAGMTDTDLPETDGEIIARRQRFDVSPLEAGTHTLRLENAAEDAREFKLLSLKPGYEPSDLGEWFARRFRGDPPADLLGIVGPLQPGERAYATVTLEKSRTYHLVDQPHLVSTSFEID